MAKSGGTAFASMEEADARYAASYAIPEKATELTTSLEQRQKIINRLKYDLRCGLKGLKRAMKYSRIGSNQHHPGRIQI